MGILGLGDMRQGRERQAIADRAVAGDKEEMAAAQGPFLGPPDTACGAGLPALHRQHETGWFGQAACKDAGDAAAFFGVFQFGILRCHVFGQIAFLDDPFGGVFESGRDVFGRHTQCLGHG